MFLPLYKVNYFSTSDIITVPIVVLNIESKITVLFVSYANKGKIKARETHVIKPNSFEMVTN